MPALEMRCCWCGSPRDPQDQRAPRVVPAHCRCGASFRPMLSTVLAYRRVALESRAPSVPRRVPNLSIIDCTVQGCQEAIHMEGGHAFISGLTVLDTPVAFGLSGGATVEAHRVYHQPGRPAA